MIALARRKRAAVQSSEEAEKIRHAEEELARLQNVLDQATQEQGSLGNEAGRIAKDLAACEERFRPEGGELYLLRSELEAQDRAAYRRLAEKERTAPNRVRSVSKRRVPPAAKQALTERSGGLCEVADPKVCGGSTLHRATHVHHLAGRVGPAPHRLSNLLHVCHTAHEWIHAHPTVSYARGWMVKRNGVQRVDATEQVRETGRTQEMGVPGAASTAPAPDEDDGGPRHGRS